MVCSNFILGVVYVFQHSKGVSYKSHATPMPLLCGLFPFLALFTMNEYESPIMKHIVVVYGDKYLSIENTNVRSNVCNEVRCSSDIVLINDGVGDMKVLINDQRDLNLRKGVKGIRKLDEKLTIFPCNFVERKIL